MAGPGHARPVAPPRHARGWVRSLTRRRLRPLAMFPAVALGLAAGVTAAWASGGGTRAQDPVPVVAEAGSGSDLVTEPVTEPIADLRAWTGTIADPLEDAVPPERVSAIEVPLGVSAEDRMAGLLSMDVPLSADGVLTVVPGSSEAPNPSARVTTVRVEVEQGLPVDGARFARLVMGILNAPQGWGADGSVSFARTDGSDPDLRVVLASPDLVDQMCAPLQTEGTYSCGRYGHAAINYLRWVQGAGAFDDMTTYRQYVVNHEVGHLLGHQHVDCPAPGELAPIMMQQTISVATCVPNGWPFPDAG